MFKQIVHDLTIAQEEGKIVSLLIKNNYDEPLLFCGVPKILKSDYPNDYCVFVLDDELLEVYLCDDEYTTLDERCGRKHYVICLGEFLRVFIF